METIVIDNRREKHARLSCSGASRWMQCPGSIRMCENIPSGPSSRYAMEGTAAHGLANMLLTSGKEITPLIGSTIQVIENSGVMDFELDAAFAAAVQVYLSHCRKLAPPEEIALGSVRMQSERQVDLRWIYKGMFGTADHNVINWTRQALHVTDLKFGRGVIVDPVENPQLMLYALGVLRPIAHFIKKVHIHVVQPRGMGGAPISSWKISTKDLLMWSATVLRPCAMATANPEAPCHAGAWCHWCAALPTCPTHINTALETTKADFREDTGQLILPDPGELTPMERAKVMDIAEILKVFAGRVQQYCQELAEREGDVPTGWKLVPKRSVRKWTEGAEDALIDKIGSDAYTRKLVGITDAEKALKAYGLQPKQVSAFMASITIKPDNGFNLVRSGDSRPAVTEVKRNDLSALFAEDME